MNTGVEVPVSVGRRWVYGPIDQKYLDEVKAIEETRPSPEFVCHVNAMLALAAGVPFRREGDKIILAPSAVVRDGNQIKVFCRPES